MEVLQIGPVAFGPQFVGPGTGSVGGCVFDASIGGVAYARLSKENNQRAAEDAMLVDAATARSEKQGEIGHYKLLAKQTTYRDKITDQIISEKTLVSPDFNYEAAGVWTSAGEPGTVGTTAEYRGTVDRARELAQIDGDASMFWVSPSPEGESSRAYLWVKKGDEVDAYQYILPGSRKAISNTMKSLGYRGNTRLEEQTILQKGSEQKIHHKDVYQALVSSLSPKEITIVKPILNKLHQEIEIPDNARKERPKYEVKPPRILSKMEYRALRDAARGDIRTYAIVELFLQTGVRIGELAALSMADVKDKEMVIQPQENHPQRTIPVNKAAREALDKWFTIRPKTNGGALFITKTGRPLLVRNIRTTIDRYFKIAGIEDAKVNDLRHTFIAHHLASGTPLTVISKLVGHKRLATTEKYLDLVKEKMVANVKLEEL